MTTQLQILVTTASLVLLTMIVELVRRRKLREEYSWLWLLAGVVVLIVSLSYDTVRFFGDVLGGILPSAILFLFCNLFIILISLHYSVKLSKLTGHVKDLAQEIAILRAESRSEPSVSDLAVVRDDRSKRS